MDDETVDIRCNADRLSQVTSGGAGGGPYRLGWLVANDHSHLYFRKEKNR